MKRLKMVHGVFCALQINSHCKKVHKSFVDYFTDRIVNLQKNDFAFFAFLEYVIFNQRLKFGSAFLSFSRESKTALFF